MEGHAPESSSAGPRRSLDKAPTFISGLDEILDGGLPRGRTTVVNGGPGSGKTVLGLEFLYRGALAGEPGILVGFEEPVAQLRTNAATLGWDLEALEREKRLFLLEGSIKPDTLMSGAFSLRGLLAAATGKTREMGARRIVIDALEVILRLFDTPQQVRSEMHMLNDWLQMSGLTTIMTIRPSARAGVSPFDKFFDSMADCVIRIDTRVADQVSTRRLRVVKYRGSGFGRNEYPFAITETGLMVAPITTVGLRHKPLGEKMPTGLAELDAILHGGYRRASCVLFAGPPGTGKTLLASTFTEAACARGEKVLYVSFEESEAALAGNMLSAGIGLQPHRETGRLEFLTNMPEAMGIEEHLIRVMARIDAFCPQHVVVDAISACERMGGKRAAFEYLMRLLNACKERGVTILLVNQTSGSLQVLEISGNGISSMVDTVVFLAYVEGAAETRRQIQVLKSRGSAHSNEKRAYIITDAGMRIMDA
jgi:circadian clock protein KaiC